MIATEHTKQMLNWFINHGVDHWDLAVRELPSGVWISPATARSLDRAGVEKHLPWCRAQNVRGNDVYIRPARGERWAYTMQDDVDPALACRIARRYAALAVRTSAAGGCQVWIAVAQPLTERERLLAQRRLCARVGSDPGSVSGEHWGRLAGLKNHKRGGQWVGVVMATEGAPWDPAPALAAENEGTASFSSPPRGGRVARQDSGRDESAAEWGWTCGALAAGVPPAVVLARLIDHARPRRGRDAERYARLTIRKACARLHLPAP